MIHVVPIPLDDKSRIKKFIKVPWSLYQHDPLWTPPLIQERFGFLNPKKNPYFEHADVQLFLAERNGVPVGRISAQIDHLHLKTHQDDAGFFGFYESVQDKEVSQALLQAAESWIRSRGMKTLRGPFNFSINEEVGFLVHGFEHPPQVLTTHTLPYYPQLLENGGYQKCKDLYCWSYDPNSPIPEIAGQIADEVRKHPGLAIREVDPKNMERDVRIIMEVFNSAWEHNWGFVPLTENEVRKAAKDFQLILDPHVALIAEIDGRPAAICIGLPNINEAIHDLNGRLFPLGLIKLLYRLKRHKVRSGRLLLLGIKKEYRKELMLNVLLFTEIHRRGRDRKYQFGELSWTLEDNEKINKGIQLMGGVHYKTYRIYEKKLVG